MHRFKLMDKAGVYPILMFMLFLLIYPMLSIECILISLSFDYFSIGHNMTICLTCMFVGVYMCPKNRNNKMETIVKCVTDDIDDE
jgi:hypothetical protein